MPLTVKQIENLKPGPKRLEVADGNSLWYVLQPSGLGSYVIRYRNSEGRLLKYKLGSAERMTLKQARAAATQKFAEIAKGADPQAEKVKARHARKEAKPMASDIIDSVAKRFLAEHVQCELRPRTAIEVKRHIGRIVAAFHGRRLSEIKRADIRAFLQMAKADAPIGANHALSWFKRLCSWAIEQDLLEASPASGIKPPAPKTSRDRISSHGEIKAVWEASQRLGYPIGPYVQMLMLSGQRRREVSDMVWSELDMPHKVWIIPAARSKNGKEHLVPLSEPMIELLESLPRQPGDGYAFTFGNGKPLNDFNGIKRQLDAALSKLPHWTFHDLRRTMRSEMSRLGVRPDIAEHCLNHRGSSSAIQKTYDRWEYHPEKAAALAKWARELDAIVHEREAKIVSLR